MRIVTAHSITPPAARIMPKPPARTSGGPELGYRLPASASENEGGQGMVARGTVSSIKAVAKRPGVARQTPRESITVGRTAGQAAARAARSQASHRLGRPGTELNFKLYRQATNKIVGISEAAAKFLDGFF